MIADVFHNYKLYSGIHKDWDRAFELIDEWRKKDIPAGENVGMEMDGFKIVMQTYKTVPEETKKYEGHKKCIDIQFMVKGHETIYWAHNEKLPVAIPYSDERDHMSFENTPMNSPIRLEKDYFAVFFPSDGHKTQCEWNGITDAVKIIVKLAL
ncbi:MAG: YhcH/YjgK/YiaL family protein [Oscillospiraceae bacterium]|jgi:YhcH/YjgK/YiaL family protein|nr:YhcH/YjgK/YiaL family protein [Oscillospiraceae bacterium]